MVNSFIHICRARGVSLDRGAAGNGRSLCGWLHSSLSLLYKSTVFSIRNNIKFGNLFVLQYGEGGQMSGNVTDHPVSHADRCVVYNK